MYEPKKKKTYTIKEALVKAAAFCAYQERNHQEVRSKLFSYGLEADEVDETVHDELLWSGWEFNFPEAFQFPKNFDLCR